MAAGSEVGGINPEPIAIVGIGCRYPQADGPRELWRLLMRAGNAIEDYSEERFPQLDAFCAASRKRPGRIPVHRGGFLHGIDRFDAELFEMSPREAMYMDPQHRLLLEVAYDALEDAGQASAKYRGSRTGVFTGLWTSDFESHLYHYSDGLDFYVMTGGGRAAASGRLSFNFGFEGPSLTVDAACSSSLVAVHLACGSLRSREVDMALAGGANIILGTSATELFTQANMLASDGQCKFGDARGDGFVRSEGAAMVVLKRLSDAAADRDPVYAVIHGSAVNNDGRTNGLMMTPSVEGQRNLLLEAWRDAGITSAAAAGKLRYLEAHGTGTSAGDPVEIEAFGTALRAAGFDAGREDADPIQTRKVKIGSIKTNIGHTESAAGVAGLIKAALAMQHRRVPPSLNCEVPNPKIDWANLPVEVLTEALDLSDAGDQMMAGVSSFGLTGTNTHVVIGPRAAGTMREIAEDEPLLFAVSAHSARALNSRLLDMARWLRDPECKDSLVDICYTSSARRSLHDHRFAAVAESKASLAEKIGAYLDQLAPEGVVAGRSAAGERKVVFVAPGQGSQSIGMAGELLEREPVFRAAMERLSAAIEAETGWSLMERAFGAAAEEGLASIDVVQPALFAVSVALAELWSSRGVIPDAVVGHSMGEVAAAHIAGILSLEDAVAVICRRSRLMKTISGSGAMASVELPAEELLRYTEPSQGRVSIGASNSPGTTVMSGDADAIDELLGLLELKDVFCRRIKVDVASHSALVDPILPALVNELSALSPRPARVALLSTVTGKYVTGIEMDAEYWRENLRQPVLFARAVQRLAREGHDCFVELSPHPILLPAIESTLRAGQQDAIAIASLRRGQPERANLLLSMGALFVAGCAVDWARMYPEQARCVALPGYPFQRESYWPEAASLVRGDAPLHRQQPLVGAPFPTSLHAGAMLWNADLDLKRLPYLGDHRVREMVVLPASAHIECALEAARSMNRAETFDVTDLSLINALSLAETEGQQIQIALLPLDSQRYSFEISSRMGAADSGWTIHSTGKLRCREKAQDAVNPLDLELMFDPHALHCQAEDHYRTMARGGIHYGPAFQLWAEAWTNGSGSLSRVRATAHEDTSADGYILHPAVLDACFQSISQIGPLADGYDADDTYLPVAMERLRLYRPLPLDGDLFVYSSLAADQKGEDTLALNLRVSDAKGNVLFEVMRLEAQRLRKQDATDVSDLLFALEWQPDHSQSAAAPAFDAGGEHWMIFAAEGRPGADGRAESLARMVASRGGCCTLVIPGRDAGGNSQPATPTAPDGVSIVWIDPASSEDVERLFQPQDGPAISAVIHVSGPDMPRSSEQIEEDFFRAQSAGVELLPRIVQAMQQMEIAPRLWMITAGAAVVDASLTAPSLNSSTIWGLGTVIVREHPELRACLVDLSPAADIEELNQLGRRILGGETADRVALRGSSRYLPKIVRFESRLETKVAAPLRDGEEFRAAIDSPGLLDELHLKGFTRPAPGRGEVAIEIHATGLNFIDVSKAMGIYPGMNPSMPVMLGRECAGRISAVGEEVADWKVGDEVVAVTPDSDTVGLLASYAVIPAELATPKPADLSMEQAAGVPIAYITAYHSLVKLAQIALDEWVLIHSGAGGVGLSCIEIALAAGAKVIATASTPEKHAYLKSLGVSHVFDSRTLDFCQQVLQATGGRGADIVVNSLTGDAAVKSLECLASHGRFIELGKRDIFDDRRIGLKIFSRNISYHAVDGAAIVTERRAYFVDMLRHVVKQIQRRQWHALPMQSLPVSDVAGAFRRMAAGKHIGKIVISIERDVQVLPAADQTLFSSDATYLITGGLGGVGKAVAGWMATHGARHLVIASRRAASGETEDILSRLREQGAEAVLASVDITDAQQVSELIGRIRREMPPLRGIMHAAAVIDDVLIKDLTAKSYERVIDAKVRGAIHLHAATMDDELDFCVYFSSIAAIYPQPGVGSYAAANLFLDSFARYRRAHGLAATSVNWGGWENTGLAREAGTSRSISGYVEQGILTFTRSDGLRCLEAALRSNAAQLLTFRFDPAAFLAFHEPSGVPSLFSILAREPENGTAGNAALPEIQMLLAAAESEKDVLRTLEVYLQQQLSKVLRLPVERIDCDRAFGTIGLDSLMGLEFVRRINAGLASSLSATVVFNYPTIRQLARHAASKLRIGISPFEKVVEAIPASGVDEDNADQMSDAEAIQALLDPGIAAGADEIRRGRA